MKNLTSLLFCAFFFLFSSATLAQTNHSIKGTISSNKQPVAFGTVMAYTAADSSFVKAGFSDSVGRFNIPLKSAGNYYIKAQIIGYAEYLSKTIKVNGLTKIGDLEVISQSENLQTFEVFASRPLVEVEADKTVFNVQNTLNATGSNGFDLLRKAPGVVVDNNNNIILEGKAGILIYINGKQSFLGGEDLVNFLQSLQSTDIDAIELITQPSSKYDAAGNAGIINIKLKKDKKLGTNGTLNLGHQYGRNHRTNAALSFNHRNKGYNIYGNVSGNLGKSWSFINLNTLQEGFEYQSVTDNIRSSNSGNTKLGADWFVNNKSTIGVLLTGNIFNTDNDGISTTEIYPANSSILNQLLESNNTNRGQNYQAAGNINYRYEDTTGQEFNADIDYGTYSREATSYQPNLYFDGDRTTLLFENNYRMITPTDITFAAAKVDYVQKLWGGKVSLGSKYSSVETDNTFDFYDVLNTGDQLNTDRSNQFTYLEEIWAGYISYARKITSKISFQGGLRMENTHSIGELTSTQSTNQDTVERRYTNWFPSGGITYNHNRDNSWSLTYSRRIQRPNYENLNPFEAQISELNFRRGNPFLQPQYTTNLRLGHLYKYRFSTSISYSYSSDFFAQITDTIGTNKNYLQPRNVADQQVINLTVSLPVNITKWWNLFANISASNTQYFANDPKYVPIGINFMNLYAQNSFKVAKHTKFEVSGWFQTPSIWGGTYLTKSMGSLNAAIEQKLLDNALSLRLAVNDMFFTAPWRADLQYGALEINGTGGWESRFVAFNVIYNFGNQNVKRARNRETSLEEEKKRAQ